MRAAPQQYIYIHLACSDEQGIGVPRGNDGVTMSEADAETTVSHDFGERKVGRVDIEVSFDQLQVWGDLPQELESASIGEVAETEDLADLAGRQEFPKLRSCQSRKGDCSTEGRIRTKEVTVRTLAGRS